MVHTTHPLFSFYPQQRNDAMRKLIVLFQRIHQDFTAITPRRKKKLTISELNK